MDWYCILIISYSGHIRSIRYGSWDRVVDIRRSYSSNSTVVYMKVGVNHDTESIIGAIRKALQTVHSSERDCYVNTHLFQ